MLSRKEEMKEGRKEGRKEEKKKGGRITKQARRGE